MFDKSIFLLLTLAFSSVVYAQTAHAAANTTKPNAKSQTSQEPLQIALVRQKVVAVDGKEIMQSAEVAKPGDVLDETATYSNKSAAPVKSLQATLPIPPNTELVVSSIKPSGAKASTDGSEFSALPLKRKVKQANGVEVEQLVPVSEYRYLRWYPGDLAAGKSLVFSARFKVANDYVQGAQASGK